MRKIACCILLITSFLVCAASKTTSSFRIRGVDGVIQSNIDKRLNELTLLKPLAELSNDELQLQVIKAIEPFGYLRPTVEIRNKSNTTASIRVSLGPRTYITSLQMDISGEGRTNPILLKTIKKIPLHTGDPLLSEQYSQAKQNIINTAENLGYLHAAFKKAEILIDEEAHTAEISFNFDTGPLYYFGQVQFDPTKISPELLHRFVPFHPGTPYTSEGILKLNNDLSGSGYFNSVLVKPKITDDQTVPITVQLQPVPKYSYSLGAGYGTDTGIRGRAAMHVIPVNRYGHKFNALAQGSFNQNALQAQYVVPGSNPAVDQYSLTGNFSNLNYSAGYSNSVLVSLAQQHNLDWYQRTLSINGLYEDFHYTAQPSSDQFVLYPKATVSFMKVKNKLFSPRGYNVTMNLLGASKVALSQIDFGQFYVDAKAALMIDPLRLRLYGHALQGFTATNNINQLPLTLALLLGGTDNLKGYSFNSIGPGKVISYAGLELQKETLKDLYLIGFYDVGSVYNPTPKAVQYDAGLALMWVSPIGPIKLGVAQPIDNRFRRIEGAGPRLVIRLGPDL